MPKTYALLDVDKTLVIDGPLDPNNKGKPTPIYNHNLVKAIADAQVDDVCLFTDMAFSEDIIDDRRKLIQSLFPNNSNWRFHCALTPQDLFWGANPYELEALNNLSKTIPRFSNQEECDKFKENILSEIRAKSTSLTNVFNTNAPEFKTLPKLGAAWDEAKTSKHGELEPRRKNAKAAIDLLSLFYPLNENRHLHAKALLLKHFLDNKPADCGSIVVCDDNPDIIADCKAIATRYYPDFPVITITVGKDFKQKDESQSDFNVRSQEILQRYKKSLRELPPAHGNSVGNNRYSSFAGNPDSEQEREDIPLLRETKQSAPPQDTAQSNCCCRLM